MLALVPDKTVVGFIGMALSILCGHMYERFQPFHVPSTNRLATVASKQLLITYIAGTLVQLGYGADTESGVLITVVTIVTLPLELIMSKADRDQQTQANLYAVIKANEQTDARAYLVAWIGYVGTAMSL